MVLLWLNIIFIFMHVLIAPLYMYIHTYNIYNTYLPAYSTAVVICIYMYVYRDLCIYMWTGECLELLIISGIVAILPVRNEVIRFYEWHLRGFKRIRVEQQYVYMTLCLSVCPTVCLVISVCFVFLFISVSDSLSASREIERSKER